MQFIQRKLKLTSLENGASGESRSVIHNQIQFWQERQLPQEQDLLHLVNKVLRNQKQLGTAKLLVHCLDGCTRSGLFLAVFNILQRMDAVGNIHIPWGILTIRETQKRFVKDVDQLRYCHLIVLKYLELENRY